VQTLRAGLGIGKGAISTHDMFVLTLGLTSRASPTVGTHGPRKKSGQEVSTKHAHFDEILPLLFLGLSSQPGNQ
jgi:hypothetical protein